MDFKDRVKRQALSICSALLLFALWIYCLIAYLKLPAAIPIQFDMHGDPTQRGPRYLFIFIPLGATLLWLKTSEHKVNFSGSGKPGCGALLARSLILLIGFLIAWFTSNSV